MTFTLKGLVPFNSLFTKYNLRFRVHFFNFQKKLFNPAMIGKTQSVKPFSICYRPGPQLPGWETG